MISHSASNLSTNCSVSQCSTNTHSCHTSETYCFEYRTQNNTIYCAPASLCSILEPCNGTCSSNAFVCVVNSCCEPKQRCLPLLFTTFCPQIRKIASTS